MKEIDAFRQMLLEQLARAEGMEALAQAARDYLQESFAVCDAAYTLITTTAPGKDDGVFVVQSSQQRIMRPEIVEEMQNKGISERFQKSREAFSIYNPSCGQWEIFCALSIHGQVAGYLFLRTGWKPGPPWVRPCRWNCRRENMPSPAPCSPPSRESCASWWRGKSPRKS